MKENSIFCHNCIWLKKRKGKCERSFRNNGTYGIYQDENGNWIRSFYCREHYQLAII